MAERKYRLQECRKAAGYKSAREFAEAIGMPVRTYTNYEQEERDLTLGLAMQFAEAMGCSIDQIAGRESHKRKSRRSSLERLAAAPMRGW